MFSLMRHIRVLIYAVLPMLFLTACGSDEKSDSSQVLWGHSAVLIGTTVKTWGANGYGQLGNGSTSDSHTPVTVSGVYTQVAVGGGHNLALTADGKVYAWGYNASGQLGNNSTSNSSTPVPVLASTISNSYLTGITSIAAGSRHSLALDSNGVVYAWGDNANGQLGNGTTTGRSYAEQVKLSDGITSLSGITAIAAGGDFNLALDSSGNVWVWGNNNNGQLGLVNSTTTYRNYAVKADGLAGVTVKNIAAGLAHSLAIDSAGLVWAWGYNPFGELGDGTTTTRYEPVKAVTVNNLITTLGASVGKISAGSNHSLAVIGSSLYSWGYNFYGQLGLGSNVSLKSEIPVTNPQLVLDKDGKSLTSLTSIQAVGFHNIASNGTNVWTWGYDAYGQLGDGNTNDLGYALKIF